MIISAHSVAPPSDATLSFRTHANYLQAFNLLVDQRTNRSDSENLISHLYSRIKASRLCEAKERDGIDDEVLKRCLSHAWGIERLLYANQEATNDDIVLRLANNWACIQAYYIFYHATQALLVAKGQLRPDSHPKTQNAFINLWTDRGVNLAPWTFSRHPGRPTLVPLGRSLDDNIHNLCHCDDTTACSLAYKALKTTREDYFEEALLKRRKEKQKERRKAWEEEEKRRQLAGKKMRKTKTFSLPQLTPSEKTTINDGLRPYSVMDYLFRLRIKANYEDADMFVDGPEDDLASLRVYSGLCNLASATLFLSELSIMSIWGKQRLLDYRARWHDTRRVELREPGLWNREEYLVNHPR